MAEYPKQFIEKLDTQCGKEAWPLIALITLDIVVMVVVVYIIGELANSLL